jgi:hypothetical protein
MICIILSSCGSKTNHRKFCLALVQNFLEIRAKESHPQSNTRGRPNLQASQMTFPETEYTEHWPTTGLCLKCDVGAAKNKHTATRFQCIKCKVSMRKALCFRIHHKMVNHWITLPSKCGKETISGNINAVYFIIKFWKR